MSFDKEISILHYTYLYVLYFNYFDEQTIFYVEKTLTSAKDEEYATGWFSGPQGQQLHHYNMYQHGAGQQDMNGSR